MLRDTIPGSQYRGRILMKLQLVENRARETASRRHWRWFHFLGPLRRSAGTAFIDASLMGARSLALILAR